MAETCRLVSTNFLYGSQTNYYGCTTRRGKSSVNEYCGTPYFRSRLVDQHVGHFVRNLLENPRAVLEGYEKARKDAEQQNQHIDDELATVQQALTKHEAKLDTLTRRFFSLDEATDQDTAIYTDMRKKELELISELKQRVNDLQAKRDAVNPPDHLVETIEQFREYFNTGLDTLDFEGYRYLVVCQLSLLALYGGGG